MYEILTFIIVIGILSVALLISAYVFNTCRHQWVWKRTTVSEPGAVIHCESLECICARCGKRRA